MKLVSTAHRCETKGKPGNLANKLTDTINVPADQIGRYAIDSLKGDVFKAALDFGTTDST